jgi:hypothetical protein
MHIDTRDLLQDYFSIVYACDAGVEKIDDSVFDVGRRNTGDRPDSCSFRFSMQERKRDVIPIAYAGFGGVARHQAMAGIVEQQSGQEMVARVPRRGSGSPLISELLLNRIE